MSFKQRTALVTLVSFALILAYYVITIAPYVFGGELATAPLKGLWISVAVAAIVITVIGLIVTQIVVSSIQAVKEGATVAEEEAESEDERDQLIDLKGKATAYTFASTGTTLAMLTYLFDQPAPVMFSLLIFFGILAQIAGDVRRLLLYREGI